MRPKKGIPIPGYCCIALLESCFMGCRMCRKWEYDIQEKAWGAPSLSQWESAITGLGEMTQGRLQVNFAGGEPLCREETLPLIVHTANCGMDAQLATNGLLLNEDKARELGRAGLKNATISLDGARSRTHDFLRGRPGSFEGVMRAIDLLTRFAPDTEIDLNTLICGINLEELPGLVRWAANDGRINAVGFQAVTHPFSAPLLERWYESPRYSFLWPRDEPRMEAILDELRELAKGNGIRLGFIKNPPVQFKVYKRYFRQPEEFVKRDGCHLMDALNITPEGEVRICFEQPALGNIKEKKIEEIWFSEQALKVREAISVCQRNCQAMVNCNFDGEKEYELG